MLPALAVGMCFTCSDISAQITTRNDAAFNAKHAAMPWASVNPHFANATIVTPNSSGPSTRATLN